MVKFTRNSKILGGTLGKELISKDGCQLTRTKLAMTKNYKYLAIWKKRDDKTAIRYNCFEIIGENNFCVQSADFFSLPLGDHEMDFQRQFVELFLEEAPDTRNMAYSTLEEAILSFDDDFS